MLEVFVVSVATEETIKIMFEDFLEWKQAYWKECEQEWANLTFREWVEELKFSELINELSMQEEHQ